MQKPAMDVFLSPIKWESPALALLEELFALAPKYIYLIPGLSDLIWDLRLSRPPTNGIIQILRICSVTTISMCWPRLSSLSMMMVYTTTDTLYIPSHLTPHRQEEIGGQMTEEERQIQIEHKKSIYLSTTTTTSTWWWWHKRATSTYAVHVNKTIGLMELTAAIGVR